MRGLPFNYTVHSMPSYPAPKLREHQIYSSHFLKGMLSFRFFENITYTQWTEEQTSIRRGLKISVRIFVSRLWRAKLTTELQDDSSPSQFLSSRYWRQNWLGNQSKGIVLSRMKRCLNLRLHGK
jgi:hypothetical protein